MTETTAFQDLSWFNLEKYVGASNLTQDQWSQQIGKRAHIQRLLDKQMVQLLDEQMHDLLSDPLAPSPVSEATPPGALGTVRPLTFGYARDISNVQEEYNGEDDQDFDGTRTAEQFDGLSHYIHLVIDIGAPDDQILTDVKEYLKRFKEQKGLSRILDFEGNRNAGLRSMPILPYFDLMAWCQWKGKELTDNQLLQLLYPEDRAASHDNQIRRLRGLKERFFTWRWFSSQASADSKSHIAGENRSHNNQ